MSLLEFPRSRPSTHPVPGILLRYQCATPPEVWPKTWAAKRECRAAVRPFEARSGSGLDGAGCIGSPASRVFRSAPQVGDHRRRTAGNLPVHIRVTSDMTSLPPGRDVNSVNFQEEQRIGTFPVTVLRIFSYRNMRPALVPVLSGWRAVHRCCRVPRSPRR